jgi:multiple sugar transport system permease protein
MTAVVGKKPPDVINQDRFTIGDWASRSTFRALDDLIERDLKRNDPYAVRKEDYYPACWAEATYKGEVFAIPNSTDDRVLFYNRKLFRQAGLDPNRPPTTWDELLAYAKKLTAFNRDGSFKVAGFIPNYGNSWLYLYSWTNGGEFMDKSGRKCTMDNRYSVEALKFMVGVYDALKGAERLDSFQSSFQPYELDPFLTDKVCMKIDVNGAMDGIARYNRDLDFGVAPPPVPRGRLDMRGRFKSLPSLQPGLDGLAYGIQPDVMAKLRAKGKMPFLTWSGGFSYAIPRGVPAERVELCWKFIKWMVSPEAELIGAKAQKEYNQRRGRAFVPTMLANIKANEVVFLKFASPEPKFRNAQRFCLDMMNYSRFRPVTFVGQMLWDQHVRAFDRAIHHAMTPKKAMEQGTYVVQKQLDKTFARSK